MIDFACKQFNIDDIVKCALGLTKADYKVFSFYLSHSSEFTSLELAKKLTLDVSTTQRALKKLTDKDLLIRSQINLDGGGYHFSYALRPKTYVKKVIMNVIHNWVGRVDDALKKF